MTEEPAATAAEVTTPPAAAEPAGEKPLGEAGEKALEAFKQRAREAERAQKDLETKLKEFEDRDKSELEKAQGRISELEQSGTATTRELQEARVEASILKAASKAGIANTEVAAKLLDTSKIEYDDSGKPKNVGKLLADLAKEHLFLTEGPRRTSLDGGVRTPVKADDVDSAIRRLAGRQ